MYAALSGNFRLSWKRKEEGKEHAWRPLYSCPSSPLCRPSSACTRDTAHGLVSSWVLSHLQRAPGDDRCVLGSLSRDEISLVLEFARPHRRPDVMDLPVTTAVKVRLC